MSTIIAGDYNTPHLIMERPMRQKINKDMEDLNNSINKLNLKYLQNTPVDNRREYTFSMVGHKIRLGQFKRIEINHSMFSDHS